MALKVGTTNITDVIVKTSNGNTNVTELYVGNTKVWGKRTFTVTLTNASYMTVSYSYIDAGGNTKSGSISSTTTFSDVGYNQSVTISASPATQTAQYTYSVSTNGGTYGTSTSSVSITGSRTTRYYDVTVGAKYSSTVLASQTVNVAYGTTVYSSSYYNDNEYVTTEYRYSGKTTNSVTVTGANQSVYTTYSTRNPNTVEVTIVARYGSSNIASTSVTVNYGTSVNSTSYYGSTLSSGIYSFSGGSGQSTTATSNTTIYTTYSSCSWSYNVPVYNGSGRGQMWYSMSRYGIYYKCNGTITISGTGYPASSQFVYVFSGGAFNSSSGSSATQYYASNYYSPSTAYEKSVNENSSIYLPTATIFTPSYVYNSDNYVTVYNSSSGLTQYSTFNSGSNTTIRSRLSSPDDNILIYDSCLGGSFLFSQYKSAIAYDGYSSASHSTYSNETFQSVKNMYGFRIDVSPYNDGETTGASYSIYAFYHNASTYNCRFFASSSSVNYPSGDYSRTIRIFVK